ncbi:MAG TPA: DUF2339 domain-containing protein, partial [Candidatus Binatia bacterium]|nr:DUF2339 domain-containing protein [Candidatus Binatia bacterium]
AFSPPLRPPVNVPNPPSAPIAHHVIPVPPEVQHKQDRDLEFKLGGKFFTYVGAVAVLFGVGFFLRFAFEQNLITETMRIVLGVIAGLAVIALGEYLKRVYLQYSQVLQGTGIGILYLTFFAAYSFYSLVTQPVAFISMILITLGGVFLAVRANSQPLAGVAQFGAYLTPFLIGLPAGDPHKLFIYIVLLNMGVLLLALWKSWRNITLGALLGSAVVYVSWHSGSYNSSLMVTSMVYLTLFFLTFLSANIYRYFVQKHKADENDLALVIFNPLFYFLAGYAVIGVNSDYIGWFAFLLASVYFVLGNAIPDDNKDAKIFHFGVGSTMLFVSIPLLFDKQWITIGWAAEAMFLMYYSLFRNWKSLQLVAHVLFMVATLRLLLFDFTPFNETQAIFNGRALTFLIVIGIISVTAYMIYWFRKKISESIVPENIEKGFEVLVIQAHIAAMFWTVAEIMKFGNDNWVGIVWAMLGLLALIIGLNTKNYDLRVLAYVTALFAAMRVILFDTEVDLSAHQPLLNMRVLSFALTAGIFGVMAYLLQSKPQEELREGERSQVSKIFLLGINLLLIWVLSLEITSYFDRQLSGANSSDKYRSLVNSKRAALSVAWSLYAGLLLAIGIARKSAGARLFSLGLFAIVIFKVFLYDTSNLSNFYRFISFISLGIILLLAGYFYNRYKERIEEFIQVNNDQKPI